jgi:YfiH family protein
MHLMQYFNFNCYCENSKNLGGIMKFQNNSNAVLNIEQSTPFLTFPSLSSIDFITHGFSTRIGGVSEGYLGTMNLGFTNGDEPNKVDENYRRICGSLGLPYDALVLSDQVHNTKIKVVTKEDKGKGIHKVRDYSGIDGLITNEKGIPLVTFYADCVPLYFVDPENRAIGLSHSGWRGTVNRMGNVTLQGMSENYGTKPENVVVLIGPSICQDCYEVSEDVAEAFRREFPVSQLPGILMDKGNGKYQLNLWEANRQIILAAGVRDENINISTVCTSCNSELLFSHRASQGKRGTLAAFLMINNEINT